VALALSSKSKSSTNRARRTPFGLATIPPRKLNYLILNTPKTAFKTDRVKVTLAANVVSGWNEIDTVQLVGSDQ
jgi:hypothetical protein